MSGFTVKIILRLHLLMVLATVLVIVIPVGLLGDEANKCARGFAGLDPLASFDQVIKGQSSAFTHSISIREGQGFVKIGYLSAEDPEFLESLANAVRAGRIAEIEIGSIVGPKVLNWIVRIRAYVPEGHSMRMTGRFSMKDLLATRDAQIRGAKTAFDLHLGDTVRKGYQWSETNIDQFDRAVDELGIAEACLKIFNVHDLKRCGMMRFDLKSNELDSIIWKRGTPE